MSTTSWIVLGVVLLLAVLFFIGVKLLKALLLALRHQRSS
jgi:hypothetical protein